LQVRRKWNLTSLINRFTSWHRKTSLRYFKKLFLPGLANRTLEKVAALLCALHISLNSNEHLFTPDANAALSAYVYSAFSRNLA
jgi:hypothetical protein